MSGLRNLVTVVVGLMSALSSTAASKTKYEIDVTSDRHSYVVGDVAHFDVVVSKNGKIGIQRNLVVVATFPDSLSEVTLAGMSPGVFTYDAELETAGEMTLRVDLVHSNLRRTRAIQNSIDRDEAEIAQLELELAQTTSPVKRFVLQLMVRVLQFRVAVLARVLEAMVEPLATGEVAIVVEEAVQQDTTPPAFGAYAPSANWTNDPHVMVSVEVSDVDSGIAEVLLIADDLPAPIVMEFDGATATYVPSDGWDDGIHDLLVVATDNAGNSAVLSVVVRVDTVAPEFTSFTPEVTADRSPTVIVVVIDDTSGIVPESAALTLQGGQALPGIYENGLITCTISIPAGVVSFAFEVSAEDYAGNRGVRSYRIWVVR